ncbi:hypothetical protein [Massilia aquatica]|uniref:Uncharacterized protein n=1 Tax=Massilia aquatica TaxID=2609000 RepID=A0ABX0M3G1_9BURK|nr:hypothetical protein [Massilia aquatica]NHZ41699.1 hypothetical protein [Massilia aquatica]
MKVDEGLKRYALCVNVRFTPRGTGSKKFAGGRLCRRDLPVVTLGDVSTLAICYPVPKGRDRPHVSSVKGIQLRRTIKILGFVGVVLVGAFFIVAWKFNSSLEPSSNIDDYQNALESLPVGLVEHFPIAVSAGAKTRFFYLPGFLQGGTTIQLSIGTSSIRIRELRAQYEAKAVEHWRACAKTRNSADLMPRLQRPDADGIAECDYNVYVLQTTPPEEWNHGHESGIAFSEKRHEVLYWAKVW